MGEAIGAVLGNAVGVAISPIPIVAVILILFSPTARINGPAFLGGWLTGLTAAFVAISAVSVAAPVVFALVAPSRADAVLTEVREWLAANNATVMMVLFAVLAAKLVGDALAILG